MTYRYFPYKGNPYHELRIAPGSAAGSVSLVVLAGSNRSESITIQATDMEQVIAEMRAQAAVAKEG